MKGQIVNPLGGKVEQTTGGSPAIETYNLIGGKLEGFAVPIGLLHMKYGGEPQIGGNSSKQYVPSLEEVEALPKGLYEKLLDLAKYDLSTELKVTKGGQGRKKVSKKRKNIATSSHKNTKKNRKDQ